MLVVKKGLQILTQYGNFKEGDELTDEILKRHPHLKKHGEEKSKPKKGKEDTAK